MATFYKILSEIHLILITFESNEIKSLAKKRVYGNKKKLWKDTWKKITAGNSEYSDLFKIIDSEQGILNFIMSRFIWRY